MTQTFRVPLISNAPGLKPKKKCRDRIPGMCREFSVKSMYRKTDEEVVAIVRRNLLGESVERIARKEGLSPETIRAWVDGRNRRHCYLAALEQYRADLRNGRIHGR